LCDGSVRVFSYNIDENNFMRLGHRADGLPLGEFWFGGRRQLRIVGCHVAVDGWQL